MNSTSNNNNSSPAPSAALATTSPPQPSVNNNNNDNNPPLSVTGQPINVNDVTSNLAAVSTAAAAAATSPYPSPMGQSTSIDGSDFGSGTTTKPLLSRQNSEETALTAASSSAEGELPNNVSTEAQLTQLPDVCLNKKNKHRPLRHVDELGRVSTYSLKPMYYSVIFILLVELLERFSFYGVEYTQTSFLTGVYNPDWNAGMSAISASSYVSISTAVAYTMPFVGAVLADSVLGEYWSILFGTIVFYIPGLLLITLSSVPYLLGETFNKKALSFGLLCMWPCGTGIVKSIVNVFGAKQFHPLLQSALIESYYVSFYMCINVGALVGGIIVPIVAQRDITQAYMYPLAMLCMGVILFLAGTPRYVRHAPTGTMFEDVCGKKNKKGKRSNNRYAPSASPMIGGGVGSDGQSSKLGLLTILRISMLIIPFNIAYSQMATTFIVQGTVMRKAFGWIDAATMNNADAVSVLLCGHIVGSHIYPALADRGIKLPTTHKFAIGSALGASAIAWALFVEYLIHSTYKQTGEQVCILWQAASYVMIGAGEIFAVSAAYEVAFTASPPSQKVIASALNLFCVGGLPNVFCIFLYNACSGWFRNASGVISISRIEDYTTSHVYLYFLTLFGIALTGIVINLLPCTNRYVGSVEEQAAEMVKTPLMKRPTPKMRRQMNSESTASEGDEESPLIRVKRHQAYLKYGSGPVLVKSGSMRAGPSLGELPASGKGAKKASKVRKVKKSQVGKLYAGAVSAAAPRHKVVMTSSGRPVRAGSLAKHTHRRQESM
eukprot:CAMPEP_0113455026 /NCGR_PEP_ID=MMETSP0014_2-20120614/8165_1 /TAXON_ID=2857 /ORGANISM="Nitzschia sp." /LENGTH=775 /DNA_ID=CAMNT_0000346447 /DNA_START=122 /DNA_END=2449 /DNA_ORIENTATION=- /assembly_acc=CAM_ASM_000159